MEPSLEGIEQSENDKNVILKYSKEPHGFLLLAGTNGTGKSYAARAIYNERTPYRLPDYDSDKAIFVTQSSMFIEWENNPKEAIFAIHKYIKTRFLVIDDFGVVVPKDGFFNLLFEILDRRWHNTHLGFGTVITTNRNSEEIRQMFGDAILSRITSGKTMRWNHKDRRRILF